VKKQASESANRLKRTEHTTNISLGIALLKFTIGNTTAETCHMITSRVEESYA